MVSGEKKISRKAVELLRTLGYDGIKIMVADSTKLADENVLGFALGEQIRSISSLAKPSKRIAPHIQKKRSIASASQPDGRSRQQPQELSPARLKRAAP